MLEARPVTDEDLALRAQAQTATWPFILDTPEEVNQQDIAWPPSSPCHRRAFHWQGELVGFGSWVVPYWRTGEGRWQTGCSFFTAKGPWREVLEWLEERVWAEPGAKEVMSNSVSHLPDKCDALLSLGYTEIERSPCTRLDLRLFDPLPFLPPSGALEELGLEAFTIAEAEARGIDWLPGLYEIWNGTAQDIPSDYPMTSQPFEDFVTEVGNPALYSRSDILCFWEGQIPVAMTSVHRGPHASRTARTNFTGVLKNWRRRGLATWIKGMSLSTLKAEGLHWVNTDNVEANPMLEINIRMGFAHWLDIINYRKVRD